MRLFLALCLVALTGSAATLVTSDTTTTVVRLPKASSATGQVFWVKDASTATDCTTGGGSYLVPCQSNGTAWVSQTIGSSAVASNGLTSPGATGIVKTTGTGNSTAIAAAGTDYLAPNATFTGEVTGTIAATALRDVLSVKNAAYGAKGDNSTDDTTAIQNAANAAGTGGKTLYFPAGTYLVSSPIEAKSSVILDPSAVVKATAVMSSVFNVGTSAVAANAVFEGGVVDANALANAGWFFRQYQHITAVNLEVRNAQQYGFHVGDPTLTGNGNPYEFVARGLHTLRNTGTLQAGSVGLFIDSNATDNNIASSVFADMATGVSVLTGGNFFTDVHVWARATQGWMTTGFDDQASGNFWKGCEADTPQTYGLRIRQFNTQVLGCRFLLNNVYGVDTTATAIHFDQSGSGAQLIGNGFMGADSSHRWQKDIDAASGTGQQMVGNWDSNVVTQAIAVFKAPALVGPLYPGTYSQGFLTGTADGVFRFTNNAATGLTQINLGPQTSSFPELFLNGPELDFKLGDGSAFTNIQANQGLFNGNLNLLPTGTANSGANFASRSMLFKSSVWTGSATTDTWTIVPTIGTGSNPTSSLSFSHSGSSGAAALSAPALTVSGALTIPILSSVLKTNSSGVIGGASYSDIVALFGSGACSGYLKSDGTCSTLSGGGGGGSAPNSYSFTAQTSVAIAHGLGTSNVLVACYDSSNSLISGGVQIVDANDVTVTFLGAQTGRCVVNGGVGPQGPQGNPGGGGLGASVVVNSFNASPVFNLASGDQAMTLTGDVTSSSVSNVSAGLRTTFQFCQDATGGHVFSWPSNVQGHMTIAPTASSCSTQEFESVDGVNLTALGFGVYTYSGAVGTGGGTSGTSGNAETLSYSATPTFSSAVRLSTITLGGNITSFTMSGAYDGQEKTLKFCQDATGGRTVTPPTNIKGFFVVGAVSNRCSSQHYSYDATKANWYADSPGVVNQQ